MARFAGPDSACIGVVPAINITCQRHEGRTLNWQLQRRAAAFGCTAPGPSLSTATKDRAVQNSEVS